ncbi:MAG TPA: tetratricopeptide repeat protein [Thermodesulfovibrionales bacterium]|nr:tetratricopeptide repeat protein [Thermodesulfovibrionales bacterium]
MISIGSTTIDALFTAIPEQQDQFDVLANNALSRGIDLYQKGNYDGAVKEFRRSVGLSPNSSYTQNAYDYMVQSLLKLGRTDEAIKAYQQAIKLDPMNDSYHLNLGNVYFSLNRYDDAVAEYKESVRINPTSTLNRYSLGQAYLQTGNYAEAERAFKTVATQTSHDANVMFALGQTYRRMGRYNDAVDELKSAIATKKDFGYAYLELGFVYADEKNFDSAQEQVSALSSIDKSLATQLGSYIYQLKNPRILAAYSTDLPVTDGPGTKVSDIDPSLATPNSTKRFVMHFIFSKPMDVSTVQNPAFWSITKADGRNWGGVYNWGMPTPATEVSLPVPDVVFYHENTQTADVTFQISQNASGDGTLDPAHLVFRFRGKDAYGMTMDQSADEYSGFSKIV